MSRARSDVNTARSRLEMILSSTHSKHHQIQLEDILVRDGIVAVSNAESTAHRIDGNK